MNSLASRDKKLNIDKQWLGIKQYDLGKWTIFLRLDFPLGILQDSSILEVVCVSFLDFFKEKFGDWLKFFFKKKSRTGYDS